MLTYPLTEKAFRKLVGRACRAPRAPNRERHGERPRSNDMMRVEQVTDACRLPRRGAGLVGALGRPALGRHARRRRALAGSRRHDRPRARRRPSPPPCGRAAAAAPCSAWSAASRSRTRDGTVEALPELWDDTEPADERGRMRSRRPLLLRVDGLRQAAGCRARSTASIPTARSRRAGRRHGLKRARVEPGRLSRLLQRHRHLPHRRLRVRRRSRA